MSVSVLKKVIFFLVIIPNVFAQGIGLSPTLIEVKTIGKSSDVLRVYNLGDKKFSVYFQLEKEFESWVNFPSIIEVPAKGFSDVNMTFNIPNEDYLVEIKTIVASQTSLFTNGAEFKIIVNVSEDKQYSEVINEHFSKLWFLPLLILSFLMFWVFWKN